MYAAKLRKYCHRAAAILLAAVFWCCATLPLLAEDQPKRIIRVPCGINTMFTLDENGEPTGACADYLERLAIVNGWEYEYIETNWPEAVKMLQTGELDLLFPTSYAPGREETMEFSSIVGGYLTSGLLAKSGGDYDYEDFDAFDGARIGVTQSSTTADSLADFAASRGFSYTPVYVESNDEKLQALQEGRVDLVLSVSAAEDTALVAVLDAAPFYFTVRKGNTALLAELNRGMQQILQDYPKLAADTYNGCLVGKNSIMLALTEKEQEFVASQEEIVLGFYEESEPLVYTADDGSLTGIYVEVVRRVQKESGLNFTFRTISRDKKWQDLLASGEIDFYVGASADIASKDAGCRVTGALLDYEGVLVTRSDCAFGELEKPVVALTQGRAYWANHMPSELENAEILYCRTVKDCLYAVLRNEADGAVLNSIEFNYQLKSGRFSSLIQWENSRFSSGAALAASSSVDDVMFSSVSKALGLLPADYAEQVVSNQLNMPYRNATFMERLYNARFALAVGSILFLAMVAIGIVVAVFRRRQEAVLRKAEEHERYQLRILAALSWDYDAIYYSNLDEDSCEVVSPAKEMWGRLVSPEESGVRLSEALRRYTEDMVLPETREGLLRLCAPGAILERFSEGADFSVRYQVKPNEKQLDFFEMHFVDVSSVQGQGHVMVMGIRCVDESAKEERLLKQLLRDALDAAQRASSAKTDFLSKMSHDIRTPMNAIIGMTAIAAAHIDNPERVQDALGKISSSSRHLLGLINEVLDMSKIESGTISLNEEEFNLSELLNSLLIMVQPQIRQHNHDLQVHILDIQHEDVAGDSLRIQQAFLNIMGNAVKYTPDGGRIVLTVREKPSRSPKIGCYEFVFADNGIGMSKEFLEHIFEPFSRAEDLRTSKIQGTGLGMAITQNIVRLMNGSIKVESELNKGSTFTVTITLKLQDKQEMDATELAELPVLVVDDDADACECVCMLLEEIGMKSSGCTTGEEAVKSVERAQDTGEDYYAAILDWKMPGMDGLETARAIKRVTKDNLPVIILSAYDWSDIELEARAAGVDAFLSKPVFKSGLIRTFKKLRNSDIEPDSGSQELKEIGESDYTGRRILLVEDNDLNRAIAREILEMAKLQVEEAENGKEAADKFAASAPGYYDMILMDIQMPVMNGYDSAMAIRSLNRPDARRVPIVAMTANAFVEDVQAARTAGMNEHLAKPIDFEKLSGVLKKYLR